MFLVPLGPKPIKIGNHRKQNISLVFFFSQLSECTIEEMDVSNPGTNQDYLNEFKAISNKLKKRFLRRPNVAEASEQFSRLAKRLRDNEEPQYEATCHIAVSRCEQSIGNYSGEVEALMSAARAFLKAEMNLKKIGGPSFQEHLMDSLDCFCNAIR